MSRYFGRHRGSAGTAQDSQDIISYNEESELEYILEAAVESDTDEADSRIQTPIENIGRRQKENYHEEGLSETEAAEDEINYVQPNESSRRKKRVGKFGRFLIIYSAVFLVLIAIGLTFFWKYISAYEISRPEHVIDDFILSMQNENGTDTLREHFQVSEFENKDAVFDKISSTYFKGQDCSYRKMAGEYTDNSPVYIIRAGGADLYKVTLEPKGEKAAGFGFQLWEVSGIALMDSSTRTITIEAPADTTIKVNDIDVPGSYITDDHVAYDANMDENRFNADSYRVLYTINGIYDEVTVSAIDPEGTELTAEDTDDNKFVYDSNRLTVKVTAPSDAVITVNGIELGKEDIKGTLFPKEMFKGLEKYADSVPDYVIYEASGIIGKPEILAKDTSGKELAASKNTDEAVIFGLTTNEELKEKNTQLVTDYIKSYVSFSTNEGDNAKGNFQRLSKGLLQGTETYKRIKDSIEGISWVEPGTVEYRVLTADDFISCGKDCFVCHVTLGITVTSAGNVKKTDSEYTLVFVRSGGVWRVGNMIAE